ncbi:uncharacterized protein LOC107260803 [Ricinus communis]|uniref:uncharacterized protein LOC107260803 n=1 Tax=Ricinus communis TaxID=3988 RepID=UPI00201A3B27|nr:uncharacterized protein LOC107260803 [Ricinus communis]
MVCDPIFKLLRKHQHVVWDEYCQKAFDIIKEYLMKPLILKPPNDGKLLILYSALEEEAIGTMVAQCGPNDVEHTVHYLSKKLLSYKSKYNLAEKTYLALIWAIKKLRHYFQSYKVQAILKIDPLKYLVEAPSLTGKLARWLVLLTKFDIEYITMKVVKGKTTAEFLARNEIEGDNLWDLEFPDENLRAIKIQEWNMYFNGAVNARGAGLGVVLIIPKGEMLLIAKRLDFKVTNNMTKYEVYLFGLEATMVARAKNLMVRKGSMMVIQQALKKWKVKEGRLKPYVNYLRTSVCNFSKLSFIHLPRDENQMATALATLSSMWVNPSWLSMMPLVIVKSGTTCYQGGQRMQIHIRS